MRFVALFTALLGLMAAGIQAQEVQRFEVASARPNRSGARGGSIDFPTGGERLTITNVPLGAILELAYGWARTQLESSHPMLAERFDISWKAESPTSQDNLKLMLRALIDERFHLKLRREMKDTPIYALVVDRGGLKMRPGTPGTPGGIGSRGELQVRNITMAEFAIMLSMRNVDRIVVDKTALKGSFDFDLLFTRDAGGRAEAGRVDNDGGKPDIFRALQGQLGLKLEAQRGLVEFVKIEKIERLSEN